MHNDGKTENKMEQRMSAGLLELTGLVAGLIGALALHSSGQDYPNPSWKKQTKPEIQHRLKQKILKCVGLFCLFSAFILAVIVIF